MEPVMHDLEHSNIELELEDYPDEHPSMEMECFLDFISYNSLIEASSMQG